MSHSPEQFNIVMNTIWKRLNDNGKFWRHVYKCVEALCECFLVSTVLTVWHI